MSALTNVYDTNRLICSHLDPRSVSELAQTCRNMRSLVRQLSQESMEKISRFSRGYGELPDTQKLHLYVRETFDQIEQSSPGILGSFESWDNVDPIKIGQLQKIQRTVHESLFWKCVSQELSARISNLRDLALAVKGRPDRAQCALFAAISSGFTKVFPLLLHEGADLNGTKRTHLHDRPLHIAARENQIETLALLIDRGADCDATNSQLETALHCVKDARAARILLQAGANVHAKDRDHHTPLHTAVRRNLPLVQLLLAHGAELDPRDGLQQTPLHLALQYSTNGLGEEFPEIIRLLLERGADPNALNRWMQSPLHIAIEALSVTGVEELLRYGANPNLLSLNRHGLGKKTPLAALLHKMAEEKSFDPNSPAVQKCTRILETLQNTHSGE